MPRWSAAPGWDPAQYLRYADERSRPFVELMARVRVGAPSLVVDLGCGPGTLTRTLVGRYPDATVVGVDSSAEMIATATAAIEAASSALDAAAEPSEAFARLSYVCADLRDWAPSAVLGGAPDVVVANAVLQWVPGHLDLIGTIAGWLAPGGSFAFQVPANFDSPSHTVIRELRMSSRWRDRLGDDADRRVGVAEPEAYLAALDAAGLEPDVWQTTFLHVLTGDNPVLEWVKGTALRPVLTALQDDPDATEDFLAECGDALRDAYPPSAAGTVFPFRRTFAVGHAGTAA